MRMRTRIVKPFLERERRYPEPEGHPQHIDEQDCPEYPSSEMAARGDEQGRAKDGKPTDILDSTHQIHIFEQRPVGTAAYLLKDPSAHENPLIPGGRPGKVASKIDPGRDQF